ncbi:MAG: carboxylesterase family protein [Candidatus Aenigmarchaeota archaeon]|nr:carboxylesterase family protein [Candidatus Aenigmarchaeota archaeon]
MFLLIAGVALLFVVVIAGLVWMAELPPPDQEPVCISGAIRACGLEEGSCAAGVQTCLEGTWGACEGEILPGQEACNGLDDDCDTEVDEGACGCMPGDVKPCGSNIGSCNEGQQLCDSSGIWGECVSAVQPSPDLCGDSVDQDCDGQDAICPAPPIDQGCQDLDGDGFGSSCPAGADCDDSSPLISPATAELCGDVLDNDCDLAVDEGCCQDADSDGYGPSCSLGADCNDTDATVSPGAAEVCGDGIDQDCSGGDLECPAAESGNSPGPAALSDVSYGGETNQVFDWYNPFYEEGITPVEPWPVIVYSHGGSFITGNETIDPESSPFKEFLQNGYAVVSVRYRLAPVGNPLPPPGPGQAIFPDQPQDVGKAIQFIRANAETYYVNPAHVIGYGESAGATHMNYLSFGPDLSTPSFPYSSRPDFLVNQHGATQWNLFATYLPGNYFGYPTLADVPSATIDAASATYWINNQDAAAIPTLSIYTQTKGTPPLTLAHDALSGEVLQNALLVNASVPLGYQNEFHYDLGLGLPGAEIAAIIVPWLEANGV